MGITIKGIEVYCPKHSKNSEEIIKEAEELGEDIEFKVKEFFGKEILHICEDDRENTLTMAIEATKKVLDSTGLSGKDIDMIVLSSMFPEYFSPPTALMIHHAINGKESAICYDINLNCIGMTFALEQIYAHIEKNLNINRVLLVGSECNSRIIESNNKLMLANMGDAACAVIIERTKMDSGIIGSKYYIQKDAIDKIKFPKCGTSRIYEVRKEEFLSKFEEVNVNTEIAVKNIRELLEENKLGVDDISMYCFSQFALFHTLYIRAKMGIPNEKSLYIGNKYGYTGSTSPFIVLYEAIKQKRVNSGDYILFWTVGASIQHICMLIKI